MKKRLLTVLLCCFVSMSYAQITIQGKVIDEQGKSIVGAGVRVEYTTISTITDKNGEFTLENIPDGEHTLRASYTGYNAGRKAIAASQESIVFQLELSPFNLNEVVITGTGTHHRLKTSPIAIEAISQKEIRSTGTQGFENTMIALNPSMSFAPNAMGSYMQLNGLSNRYILVLVDGKKLAGDVSGNTDLSRINTENIRRIEVLKGAASSLYGSEAIAGVINIITDKKKESVYLSSNTRVSEYGQFMQSVNADVNIGWLSSSTAYQRSQTNGWQLSSQEVSKGVLKDTDKKAVNTSYSDILSQHFTFRASNKLSFYTEGSLFDKKFKRPVPTYKYDMRYEDYALNAGGRYLLSGIGLITLDMSMDNFEYYKDYTVASEGFEVGEAEMSRRQRYYNANLKGVFSLGNHHRLSVGTQYQLDYLKSLNDVKGGSRDVYTWSLYAQDEIKLFERLQLVPGVRYAYSESFGSNFTPKLAAMYSLGSFNFRASYAAGYRTPDLKQLYNETISGTTINIGDPNLKPEKSNYYSANAEFLSNSFTISISGYINKLEDIIVVRQQELTPEDIAEGLNKRQRYTNASEAKVQGIDVSINTYLGYGLTAGAGYSYLHSKDYDTGNPLTGNSRHIGNANLSWNKKWWALDSNIRINGRLQSKRYYEDEYAPTYQLWNMATTHRIKSFWGLTLEPGFGIENIFDYVDDRPFGSRYATLSPGRTVYASLSIKFSSK